MHSETKNKQTAPNIHLIGIVLHSYCHSHKSHWFLADKVLVPLYKVYFSIRINKNGNVHLGSMELQISIKQLSKITVRSQIPFSKANTDRVLLWVQAESQT